MGEELDRLCSDCAKNPYIRDRICAEGISGFCFECSTSKQQTIEIDRLAEIVEQSIRENLVDVTSEEHVLGSFEKYGISVDEAIFYMVGPQSSYFHDKLVKSVFSHNEHINRNDNVELLHEDTILAPRIFEQPFDYFSDTWYKLNDELKHRRRFFSENVRVFFDLIFDGISGLGTWARNEGFIGFTTAVQTLDVGYRVYRARQVKPEDIEKVTLQPSLEVGPPPKSLARANRMSPEGVVALYCATDIPTAIAETRPAIGSTTAVIAINLEKPLRVLNFSRLENVLEDNWERFVDPSYDGRARQARIRFLKRLHNLISEPIVPGNESEYLITQTMAEYLAHVHDPSLDGIIFKSVQHNGGVNLVLFADKNSASGVDAYPISYVPDSLQFYSTDSVSYKNSLRTFNPTPHLGSIKSEDAENDWFIEQMWTPPGS